MSLVRNIFGTTDEGREKVFGRLTQLFDPNDPTFMGQPAEGFWMRTKKYHYVWDIGNGEELLFDMESDPMNDTNIAAENVELIEGFKADILNWKEEMGI